eukprot:3705581-Prymnesium_polylepis.1
MPPHGVVETTGGGGGRRHAAWDGVASVRTTDGSGASRNESRMAGSAVARFLLWRQQLWRCSHAPSRRR